MAFDDDWQCVNDPDAADALLRGESFRFLTPFLGDDRTLGEAARVLGVSVARMHYQVRRLLSLGLLRQVGETPRRGRPTKRYRAASSRFYVPFAATRLESLEALMTLGEEGEQRRFVRDFIRGARRAEPDVEGGGTLVHVLPEGHISVDFTPTFPPGEAFPPVFEAGLWSSWTTLELTPDEAAELERDLVAFWRDRVRRHGQPGPGRRAYTLRLGLAPNA